MNKWNLIIDVAKCHDCNNCFLACKDEHCENDHLPYAAAQPRHGQRWIDLLPKERGQYPHVDVAYLPYTCMQCDNPECMQAAEDGAVYQRQDGIVIIDPLKAKGQKAIVDSCPYGVIWWNEALELPQKCTFCAHLLDEGWKEPRCVQACPTGALKFLSLEDAEMQQMAKSEGLEVWHADYGLEPRVYYRNLFRYNKCFVAGSVALKDMDECANGAQVTLLDSAGNVIDRLLTNNYGDFKFDGLGQDSGRYRLEVEYPGYKKQAVDLQVKESIGLGTIFL